MKHDVLECKAARIEVPLSRNGERLWFAEKKSHIKHTVFPGWRQVWMLEPIGASVYIPGVMIELKEDVELACDILADAGIYVERMCIDEDSRYWLDCGYVREEDFDMAAEILRSELAKDKDMFWKRVVDFKNNLGDDPFTRI